MKCGISKVGTLLIAMALPWGPWQATAQSRSGSLSISPGSTSLGASGPTGFTSEHTPQIYGGSPGASPGRYQPALLSQPRIEFGIAQPGNIDLPEPLPGREVEIPKTARPGAPEPPLDSLFVGQPGGITLDEAIELLVRNNLTLRSQFSELPQAEADVLTASLRANPILYADAQQVPYGSYSPKIAGGPIQYDVNVVYPLDLSHKRQARTRVAAVAKRAVEARYRDAVRLMLDNLYTAYTDALVAQDNIERKPRRGPGGVLDVITTITVDEPHSALQDTQRILSVLLNMPFEEVARRRLHGRYDFRKQEESPLPPEGELVRMALASRPDLPTQRLAVATADANVRAVMANRFEDVLLLYQPYTFRDGTPFDQKNSLSWTLGVTVPLPVYNRQQGNLQKARLIAEQERTRYALVQNLVISEVRRAVLEHETAHQVIRRTWDDYVKALQMKPALQVPGALTIDPEMSQIVDTLEKLKNDSYDDKGRKYKEAIVRHRRSMLRLNTAVAEMLMH
jgi:cobalt-zinc-cadmium efflux system outer membrane protein